MEIQEQLDLLDWLEDQQGVSQGDAAFMLNKFITTDKEFSEIWLGYLCDKEHLEFAKTRLADKATSDACIAEDLMKKYNALDEAMKAAKMVYA